MADKTTDDAEIKAPAAAPKKKGKIIIIIALVAAVGAGAAGSFFFIQSSAPKSKTGSQKSKKSDEAENDQRQDKESADDKEAKSGDKASGDKGKPDNAALLMPKDQDVKSVIEIQPFILNLADKEDNRFLRVSMSLGLGDESEEKPDTLFMTRVRSAVLSVLMTKTSAEVLSLEGKAALRKEMLQAIRNAADEPHVEAIYITELIVQR